MVAVLESLLGGGLPHGVHNGQRRGLHIEVGTGDGFPARGLDGHLILPIHEQVAHVIGNVGAVHTARAGAGHGPRLQAKQSGLELVLVGGEFEHGLARGGVNGGPVGGLQGGSEEAGGGFADADQVLPFQMHVVEQIGDEAGGDNRRRGAGGWSRLARLGGLGLHDDGGSARFLDREAADDLRLAVVQNAEIVLGQVPDGAALIVAHNDGDRDQIHARGEGGRGVLGENLGGGRRVDGGFRRGWGGGGGRRSLLTRGGGEGEAQNRGQGAQHEHEQARTERRGWPLAGRIQRRLSHRMRRRPPGPRRFGRGTPAAAVWIDCTPAGAPG